MRAFGTVLIILGLFFVVMFLAAAAGHGRPTALGPAILPVSLLCAVCFIWGGCKLVRKKK